ncbi:MULTISPECIES: GFA family protein [Alphaproteobacteria]|uniref:Aldehyde-activating protein n=2 Tax=Alphaproteobacteria TaxID=28211 RepID=A0A512HHU5_9HYPH|nr:MULTISPECIES: GFA family protein [Alphaproteobacteria]GEO85013.1 aldehyde-activating protein [Ciceribacter naphthalenivorans]GLR22947.1 aldehyde-activating protein [Ciceribacter naphthalenivorans]GLT05803.1 aldehyde-activating protein [Sphingomonas psychrolutea]
MSQEDRIIEGGCRCEQVRLKVKGRPVMTFACHCTGCQKMTASAFSLSSLYPEQSLEVFGLEPVIGGLHGELRHFCCPYCMSWIFTRFDGLGPFVNVRATMLGGSRDFRPFIETCTSEKLPWAQTPARHSYPHFPPMEAFPALMAEFAASDF